MYVHVGNWCGFKNYMLWTNSWLSDWKLYVLNDWYGRLLFGLFSCLLFKPQEPPCIIRLTIMYHIHVSFCKFCVLSYVVLQRNGAFWGHCFRTALGRFSVLLFMFMYLITYLVNDAHICTGLSLLCYWVVQTMFHVLIKIYLTNLINTLTEKCL